MNKYTVITDTKTPDFYKNEMESFTILAKNIKEAQKIGRLEARMQGVKFVAVKRKR